MRVAVVGHVEWIEFARVERMPTAGQIVHATDAWEEPGGPFEAAVVPGMLDDTYGAGDCFAAGLTFGLADGRSPEEAVELAARCGAAVLTGRGAYAGQLTL